MILKNQKDSDTEILREFGKLFRCDCVDGKNECEENFNPVEGERIGEYEIAGLYGIFLELTKYVYKPEIRELRTPDRLKKVVEKFNILFEENEENHRNYILDYKIKSKISESLFDGLYLSSDDQSVGRELVSNFIESYNQVIYNENKSLAYFRSEDVERYLDCYLKLSSFVFGDSIRYQEELKSKTIIEDILNIYYCDGKFGLYSPFVLLSVSKTLGYISILPNGHEDISLSYECRNQLDTRGHIISTHAIRSFSRFTIFDRKSYVVEYSRRNNCIICRNAELVSSVDNIKPIRLFEKITSYIYNYFSEFKNENKTEFNISIYGYCFFQKFGESIHYSPAEIDDLVYEIFSWFEDKRETDLVLKDKTIEMLNINYFLVSDKIKDNKHQENSHEKKIYEFHYKYYDNNNVLKNKCNVVIHEKEYKQYDNQQLDEIIKSSDIIFILDSPWLTIEDFNIASEGDLGEYANWISQISYKTETEEDLLEKTFYDKNHLFASLNNQLNRLAVDNMCKYGSVVRVAKDYLLEWIQEKIKDYQSQGKYKTVYVYNSSLRGMSFSEFADYPVIREESYSNKRFSIMRFSTRDNQCVPLVADEFLGKENKIYISLWNLIKYVDISFAFIGIKNYFVDSFYKFIDEINDKDAQQLIIGRDIVSILRNIVFVVDYYDSIQDATQPIKIKISLSAPVRDKYIKYLKDGDMDSRIIDITNFFKKIITQIIFNNTEGLGDDCIREAFAKCLNNQAKTVDDLFFLHIYSQKREKKLLHSLNVQVDTNSLNKPDEKVDELVPNFDAFGDKRAYNRLFNFLDLSGYPRYAVNSLLNQVNNFFYKKETPNHSNEILRNIKQICERYHYEKSFLYENIKSFTQ